MVDKNEQLSRSAQDPILALFERRHRIEENEQLSRSAQGNTERQIRNLLRLCLVRVDKGLDKLSKVLQLRGANDAHDEVIPASAADWTERASTATSQYREVKAHSANLCQAIETARAALGSDYRVTFDVLARNILNGLYTVSNSMKDSAYEIGRTSLQSAEFVDAAVLVLQALRSNIEHSLRHEDFCNPE